MKKNSFLLGIVLSLFFAQCTIQREGFNGVDIGISNLHKLSNAETFSISPENFTGEKGKGAMDDFSDTIHPHHAMAASKARELGQGWKLNPAVRIRPGEVFTLAEIEGPGAIQHIWMTPKTSWRLAILRIYWDDEEEPSVETPLGDFFAMGLDRFAPVNSLPVIVNPGSGFNSFWTMPFREKCRMTVENLNDNSLTLFYQIDYVKTKIRKDDAYFHAQYRQVRPNPTSLFTIADGIKGEGHFVGLYMTWKANNPRWWGEGELKFYLDGDKDFPTIAGTGTEDYFLGSYAWYDTNKKPMVHTNNYSGVPQIIYPDSINNLNYPYYSMYRWHIKDPIRFKKNLKITVQDLGWKGKKGFDLYLAQHSDITSVVYWYQTEPHGKFSVLPPKDKLKLEF